MNTLELCSVLQEQLKRVDGRTSPWNPSYEFNYSLHDEVYNEFIYFDDINSFPLVSFVVEDERVLHAEGNQRYIIAGIEIRGYTYDTEVEQSGEALAQDIEHVVQYLRQEAPAIDDIRLLEVQTDSGLNQPHGACIIKLEAIIRR